MKQQLPRSNVCTDQNLSIGFEFMSPNVLDHIHKKIYVKQNRKEFHLLRLIQIRYLLDEYSYYAILSAFSFPNGAIPVRQDIDRFNLTIVDTDNPDYTSHFNGINFSKASSLHQETIGDLRGHSDDAVLILRQADLGIPLMPGVGHRTALRPEKTVECIVMLSTDFRSHPDEQRTRVTRLLDQLVNDDIELRQSHNIATRVKLPTSYCSEGADYAYLRLHCFR
jgi:hypothetical protein